MNYVTNHLGQPIPAIVAPNSVARFLSVTDFGKAKFCVLSERGGRFTVIAAKETEEEARASYGIGRILVDIERVEILK